MSGNFDWENMEKPWGVWGTPFSDTRRNVVSWVASNMLCFDDGRTSLSEFWMFVAQVERTNMKGELTNLLRYCPRQYFLHGSLRLDIKQFMIQNFAIIDPE